jgi:TonB family protein
MPVLVGLGMTLAAQANVEASVLEPVGRWSLDYGESGCLLARTYAAGSSKVLVGWRAIPFDDNYELVVQSPAKEEGLRRGVVTVSVDPGRRAQAIYRTFPLREESQRRLEARLETALFEGVEDGAIMSISPSSDPAFSIRMLKAKNAFAALKRCGDENLVRWGMDPSERARVALAPVWLNMGDVMKTDSYPRGAIEGGAIGSATVLLALDEAGKVASCRVVLSSGTASLDAVACKRMPRARFSPARDASGRSIASHFSTRINWDMGGWHDDGPYRTLSAEKEREYQARRRTSVR